MNLNVQNKRFREEPEYLVKRLRESDENAFAFLLDTYGKSLYFYCNSILKNDTFAEDIVQETLRHNIKLVGLSALMTTTVKSIKDTVDSLREAGADCKVMAGGAVLNEEYAKMVGADYYAKDAAESAKIAKEVFGK